VSDGHTSTGLWSLHDRTNQFLPFLQLQVILGLVIVVLLFLLRSLFFEGVFFTGDARFRFRGVLLMSHRHLTRRCPWISRHHLHRRLLPLIPGPHTRRRRHLRSSYLGLYHLRPTLEERPFPSAAALTLKLL